MKPTHKYGLAYGGISIIFSLLMYVTELNRQDISWLFNTLSLVIPILCVVAAIKEYKAMNEGFITFGNAFKKAMVVVLIGGVISAAYIVLYTEVIDPEFMEFSMNKQEEKMAEMGMSEMDIEVAMARNATFQTPVWMFSFSLLMLLFVGLIISLISAGIMKNPNPEEIV